MRLSSLACVGCLALVELALAGLAASVPAGEAAGAGKNLLANADFAKKGSDGRPADWVFGAGSRDPLIMPSRETVGGVPAAVIRIADAENTAELYGYWGQAIAPPPPGRYAARFRVRTEDMKFAVWISADSSPKLFLRNFKASGATSRKDLEKFIDREMLRAFSADEWRDLTVEMDIPELKAGERFWVRIGAYGATAGWLAVSRVWFGRAEDLEPAAE